MKRIDFKSRWGSNVSGVIEVNSYTHGGGTALELWCVEDGFYEPWAFMTVNLEPPAAPGCAYLDTNNFPEVEEIMKKYDFGEPTGRISRSGFCLYPEYRLNMAEINEYVMEEVA